MADDLKTISTHFNPVWRNEIWGNWATDPRGLDPEGEPFDVPMQGMGVFSCRKEAWLGFNPAFRGFGGEEGYIHEKFRQAGARTLCLPWLRWVHRFRQAGGRSLPGSAKGQGQELHHRVHRTWTRSRTRARAFLGTSSEDEFAALVSEALADSSPLTPSQSHAPQCRARICHEVSPAVVQVSELETGTDEPTGARRAIVCFVEDNPHLIQQVLALRLILAHHAEPGYRFGGVRPRGGAGTAARRPGQDRAAASSGRSGLARLPLYQRAGLPQWRGRRSNWKRYSHILRTDVDTFITPAWNAFSPSSFTYGAGARYASDDSVCQRVRDVAAEYGLVHRGMTNIGSTWYGPTAVVRRAAGFAEMLTKHLLTHDFASDAGRVAWMVPRCGSEVRGGDRGQPLCARCPALGTPGRSKHLPGVDRAVSAHPLLAHGPDVLQAHLHARRIRACRRRKIST